MGLNACYWRLGTASAHRWAQEPLDRQYFEVKYVAAISRYHAARIRMECHCVKHAYQAASHARQVMNNALNEAIGWASR